VATAIYGFIYFGMLNSLVPTLMFLAIMLSWVPHDMMYGPQAALIAECFTPRLRYSGSSIGYQGWLLTLRSYQAVPSFTGCPFFRETIPPVHSLSRDRRYVQYCCEEI
jgi:hypothetical protein